MKSNVLGNLTRKTTYPLYEYCTRGVFGSVGDKPWATALYKHKFSDFVSHTAKQILPFIVFFLYILTIIMTTTTMTMLVMTVIIVSMAGKVHHYMLEQSRIVHQEKVLFICNCFFFSLPLGELVCFVRVSVEFHSVLKCAAFKEGTLDNAPCGASHFKNFYGSSFSNTNGANVFCICFSWTFCELYTII